MQTEGAKVGSFKPKLLIEICEQQGWLCWLCSGRMSHYGAQRQNGVQPEEATIEHKVPKSMGGGNERSNLAATHARCNNERSKAPDVDLLLDMDEEQRSIVAQLSAPEWR